MTWKTFLFFAALTVGVSAGPYKLQGQRKDRLENTLDNVCSHLPDNQKDLISDLAMGAVVCIYESVDDSVTVPPDLPTNATLNEQILNHVAQICSIRLRLRTCAQQLLEYLAPCTSEAVQAQIGDMKIAISNLFSTFCDNDMAKPRRFLEDGAVECIENKSDRLDNCTSSMLDLVTNMPNDTKSFEAIEMCYQYDQMTSCALNILSECPKPSIREFMENLFSLFRSGTYCRVTVPVGGNEVDSAK